MRKFFKHVAFSTICLSAVGAFGDTTVLPASFASTDAEDNYAFNSDYTHQQLFSGSAVAGLPIGAVITGMRLRLDGGQPTIQPTNSTDVSTNNLDVRLGHSNNTTLSTNFASNEAADTILTRSGPYTFAAGSLPGGATPNAFGSLISFTTPYVYTGGPLLLTMSYTSPSAELFFDYTFVTPGMQAAGQVAYNATTAISVEQGQGFPVQFVYSVPEPSFTIAATAMLFGIANRRRR